MMEIFEIINNFLNNTVSFLGIYGPIVGCILIVLESMIPILPLCVFITLNCMAFGYVIGYLISWFFTCIGCFLSFTIFDKWIKGWFEKKIRKKESVNRIMKVVEKCSLTQLAMIVAVPFTPAFLVNIAAGLSNMSTKKFMAGILIGKLFMVYFWAFIGTSFVQSLTNPIIMVRIVILLFIAYVLSKIVTRKFNL